MRVIGVVSVVEGGSIGEAFVALGLTAVFATFMLMVARPLLAAFARRSSRSGQLSLEGVAVIVAGLLASAYVTELIGIHAIFGAFLFGAIMPKRTHLTKELTDRIEDFTVVVLLPLFFAVAGLRAEPSAKARARSPSSRGRFPPTPTGRPSRCRSRRSR